MKIPETSANVGAYYGNEENGQWQPNGVVIDNGVGGGVVGSGDAGVRPVYPVHIPRHMPSGYVMAGAYYPPQFGPPVPPQPTDFEDYMWMENEEEFDKQVIQQLEEEALMEQCIEAMLEDEQRERRGPRRQPRDPNAPTTSACNGRSGLSLQEAVSRSTLNPLAAEFVPTRPRARDPAPAAEVSESTKSAESSESVPATEKEIEAARSAEPSAPEAPSECAETPERTPAETEEAVSSSGEITEASVVPASAGKRERRADTKRSNKAIQEVKKSKPQVRSEPQLKKEVREPRAAKSESDEPAETTAPVTQTVPVADEEASGIKPINYAAAAKAVKPKPKPQEKEKPKPQEKELKPKPEKEVKKEIKVEKKEAKPKTVSKDKLRKNSGK